MPNALSHSFETHRPKLLPSSTAQHLVASSPLCCSILLPVDSTHIFHFAYTLVPSVLGFVEHQGTCSGKNLIESCIVWTIPVHLHLSLCPMHYAMPLKVFIDQYCCHLQQYLHLGKQSSMMLLLVPLDSAHLLILHKP